MDTAASWILTAFSVATWNVNSIRRRIDHVTQWLTKHQPTVLALQETKVEDDLFPSEPFEAIGYQVYKRGQKRFNGVAMLVKRGIEFQADFSQLPEILLDQKRVLPILVSGVWVVNVYVPNGADLSDPKFGYKMDWLKALEGFLKQLTQPTIVLGDFNIAPADQDTYDPAVWKDCILVSQDERGALDRLCQLGFTDLYRELNPNECEFTWWDYRANRFQRKQGLRIDLILANGKLSQQTKSVEIDAEPRGWSVPSDHTPVIAYIDV
ncbi:exodeoxyribonuclease III [Gammaproteobacteria bacterium]|nr:exodeoxyribonuclease III [Gammaproteobacteria bacterium]